MNNRYLTKIAEMAEQYSMPLDDAIKEHLDLTRVLESNDRKEELKELKDQGGELKEMLERKEKALEKEAGNRYLAFIQSKQG